MLIGLSGLAGSGKSEVAAVLMHEFGFVRVKFADPLKNMLRTMLRGAGHIDEDVERMIEGDLKEVEIPELGVTPRHLMITLGTEWGRDCVRKDLWIRLWKAAAEMHEHVIADDVRFPNEVDAIREAGGQLWRIERPGLVRGGHVSEALIADADGVIHNSGTIGDLRGMARVCVHKARLAATKPAGPACA
jgi:hypothetical protein